MVADWEQLILETSTLVKSQLEVAWPLEADGSGPPERVAIQAAIELLRPRISVVVLRVDRPAPAHFEDEICVVLVYDFTSTALAVDAFAPELTWNNTKGLIEVLSRLEVPFAQSFGTDLEKNTRGMSVLDSEESHKIVQFLPYDPRKSPARFATDLHFHLQWWLEATVVVQDPLADYAVRFGITPTLLRPDDQLLDPALQWRAMARWRGGSFSLTSMADLARDVAEITLIPAVPLDVQVTFRRAMALYVYGYLHYDFLTLAPLVAYMALEAAVRHRWCQSFRPPVTLRLPKTRKDPEETVTWDRLTYERAIEWCKSQGRFSRDLLVNGQRFPGSFRQLLDRLGEWGALTLWERRQAEEGWEIRSGLAHPEEYSMLWPGFALRALRRGALIINRLFDPARATSE